MTDNEKTLKEFKELCAGFVADGDFAEIEAAFAEQDQKAAAEKAAKPAKDGLAYAGDVEGANGHTYSLYAMTLNGRHVFNAMIDNFVEVPIPADMGHAPAGVTAHVITIVKPGQVSGITTAGMAFRMPHNDGTGTHVDGRSVQSYVYPRAVRFLIELYV